MAVVHIVGLGAIGAAFGAALADAGHRVRVLLDPDRAERYRQQPTVVNGRPYSFAPAADAPLEMPQVVIVAVKYPALSQAITLMRPWITEGTVVLSLLNGIGSEADLRRAFPVAEVPLAVCVGIDAVREERQVRYSSIGRVVLGADDAGPSPESLQAVTSLLESAGIAVELPADMPAALWWKFMVNVGVNQVSAVLRAPYRLFQRPDSAAREVMLAAQREVIAVANSQGIGLGTEDLERWLEVLDLLGPDSYTSMAQDALAGRSTEVDIFAGEVVRLGEEAGVDTPVNRTLLALLHAADQNTEARR